MNVLFLWIGFLCLWCCVAWMARIFQWSVELSRKAVHIGMGLVCTSFPWIFSTTFEVWCLAALCVIPLAIVRYYPNLREGSLGSVLHGVRRNSWGELLFAPSVALAFTFGNDRPYLFATCILLLAVADAAGAFAGKRWGKKEYQTLNTRKTLEGSIAVVCSGVIIVFSAMILGENVEIGKSLMIAVIAGSLVGMIEAVADSGFDNITIPLGMYLILERLVELDNFELAGRIAMLGFLLAILKIGLIWSTLNGGALIAGCLLLYACQALGSWIFLLPLIGMYVMHLLTSFRKDLRARFSHGVAPIAFLAIPVIFWLAMATKGMLPHSTCAFAVSWACAAYLALTISITSWQICGRHSCVSSCLRAIVVCVTPLWIIFGGERWTHAISGMAICLLGVFTAEYASKLDGLAEYFCRGLFAILASLIVFIP